MMTKRDPYMNMLRATIAAFSAGLGGADSVTVLPYTAALGLPDAFARRVARNTQLVLIEEANVHRVADAGAGAGAIESITDELCAAAWRLFQGIEAAGGAAEALASGYIQQAVTSVRKEREVNVARLAEPLVGTSVFSNPDELPVTVLDVAHPALSPLAADSIRIEPLAPLRLGEPFE
jgi:methylmalonyl-CoA mutase